MGSQSPVSRSCPEGATGESPGWNPGARTTPSPPLRALCVIRGSKNNQGISTTKHTKATKSFPSVVAAGGRSNDPIAPHALSPSRLCGFAALFPLSVRQTNKRTDVKSRKAAKPPRGASDAIYTERPDRVLPARSWDGPRPTTQRGSPRLLRPTSCGLVTRKRFNALKERMSPHGQSAPTPRNHRTPKHLAKIRDCTPHAVVRQRHTTPLHQPTLGQGDPE